MQLQHTHFERPFTNQHLFVPVDTGAPRDGVFAHISSLGKLARLDFERYALTGETIIKVEGDRQNHSRPTSAQGVVMRILVVSKGSGTGAGESQATRYVARRKNEPEREANNEPTRLFSAAADSLGHRHANLVLGDGHIPATRDVLHLVISFAHEADFLALGDDEKEREAAIRDLTRATLVAARDDLNAAELRWVAGLHRNTDNPHLHLLIQRDYHERGTARAKRLQTMSPAWQVRWETSPTGERQTQPGALARSFESRLEERLQHAHSRSAAAPIARTDDELERLAAQMTNWRDSPRNDLSPRRACKRSKKWPRNSRQRGIYGTGKFPSTTQTPAW